MRAQTADDEITPAGSNADSEYSGDALRTLLDQMGDDGSLDAGPDSSLEHTARLRSVEPERISALDRLSPTPTHNRPRQ